MFLLLHKRKGLKCLIRRERSCDMVNPKEKILHIWKRRAGQLRTETYAIYLAYKDPRVLWYAKLLIACVVGYAFSPIDLIPDFVPILGYVGDLILVPIGIALVIEKIPPAVLADCREKAHAAMTQKRPRNWVAASVVIIIRFLFGSLAILFTTKMIKDWDGVLNWWSGWAERIARFPAPHN
jgi:uncharacterized membrane protein YkvA (DUF1232 family)